MDEKFQIFFLEQFFLFLPCGGIKIKIQRQVVIIKRDVLGIFEFFQRSVVFRAFQILHQLVRCAGGDQLFD